VSATPSTSQTLRSLRPSLEAIGLVRRRDSFYTMDTAPGFAFCVGLGSTVGGHPKGVRGVWPVVGVRHDPTERLLAQFRALRTPLMHTVGTPLGYLTPMKQFREWELSTSQQYDDARYDLASAIQEWGMPFFRAYDSLESLLQALDDGLSLDAEYTRPVVLLQLGRIDDALAAASALLAGPPPEPTEYTEFVREWVARFNAEVHSRVSEEREVR
jgi:hypothetical protein